MFKVKWSPNYCSLLGNRVARWIYWQCQNCDRRGGYSSLSSSAAQNWPKTAINYWRDAGTLQVEMHSQIATFFRLIYFTFFALVRQLYLLTEDVAVNPVLYYHNTDWSQANVRSQSLLSSVYVRSQHPLHWCPQYRITGGYCNQIKFMLLQCFCLFLLVHAGADPEGTAGGEGGVRRGFEAPKVPSRDAKGVEENGEWGWGFTLPRPTRTPEPRPKTDFSAFQVSQNACRWDVSIVN